MKFVMDNWMLIVLALTSGSLLLWPVIASGGGAGTVTPAEAVLLMNREKAVVVDVCEAAEYAAGHVIGSRNVPLGELQTRLPDTVKNKALPLVFLCARGSRARQAVGIAKKLGYEKAQAVAGGLAAWKDANLPVEKG